MPLKLKKKAAPVSNKPRKVTPLKGSIAKGSIVTERPDLEESKSVKVFDIPVGMLVEHSENPNVQSEKVHDELIEKIKRDGFDEPIIVVPHVIKGIPDGKYLIVSGHHRTKAAKALGITKIPGIIREGWSEDQAAIELISRNSLTGNMDPYRFTELFDRLKKRYDPAQLQKMMGLTEKKAFAQLYKRVADSLPPKAKKKLEDAKETIKSVDDLTGILNTIFTEHGSELDWGFMVFSHGGKNHHYVKIGHGTEKRLKALEELLKDNDIQADDFFAELLADEQHSGNVIERIKNAQAAA